MKNKNAFLLFMVLFVGIGVLFKMTNELPISESEWKKKVNLTQGKNKVSKSNPEAQDLKTRLSSDTKKRTIEGDLEYESKMKSYIQLSQKKIKTKNQFQAYQALLSDSRFLGQNYLKLAHVDKKLTFVEQIKSSMAAIDVLYDAMAWRENPIQRDVIQDVKYLLLQDIVLQTEDIQLRKAIAGNQTELYLTLREHAPNVASEIRDIAKGKRLGHLIQLAEDHIK